MLRSDCDCSILIDWFKASSWREEIWARDKEQEAETFPFPPPSPQHRPALCPALTSALLTCNTQPECGHWPSTGVSIGRGAAEGEKISPKSLYTSGAKSESEAALKTPRQSTLGLIFQDLPCPGLQHSPYNVAHEEVVLPDPNHLPNPSPCWIRCQPVAPACLHSVQLQVEAL